MQSALDSFLAICFPQVCVFSPHFGVVVFFFFFFSDFICFFSGRKILPENKRSFQNQNQLTGWVPSSRVGTARAGPIGTTMAAAAAVAAAVAG
jgi:hypothetical protein